MSEESKDKGILNDSKVSGKVREIGPAEEVRRANNHYRDSRTNLGKGKPSDVVITD